jgi:hypothetical protein
MNRLQACAALLGITTALGVAACGSDEPQKNPKFTTGATGSDGGARATSTGSGEAGESTPGSGTSGAPEQASAGGATPSPSGASGAAGAGPEVASYDCVLHPTTHLEIINACTDSMRIEKHPELPALPQ